MNIAELGIAIHSEEAVKAATDLDRLAEAGERAEKSTADLASEAEELDKSLSTTARTTTELSVAEDSLAKSIESANDRIREMVKASLESSEYHQSLAASVTGTSAAMEDAKGAAVDWAAYQEEVNARAQALLATEEQRIASAEKMAAASKKEEESLKKLLAEIDPTRAAIAKLDQQVEELGKQFEAGSIDLETYTKGLEHFDGKYAEIEKVSGSFSKLNLHTKGAREDVLQLGNALTSGNWQGAIRNVTQLGVGASLSATSLIAMVAPIALVVGAVGGLAHGYLRGRKEQDAFNESLVMTGNIAGTTSGQLADMARQVGGTVGTTGTAAAALAHIAGTGKIASESFELVATAALQMEQATGRAVGHTIDEFVKIAGDPVRAARELNDQYHFLTAATYSQIVALEEQGDTIGAAKLLTDAYANTIGSRTAEITENLGLVERAWNAVKGASAGALDSVKNIGREQSLDEEIEELQKQLANPLSYVTVGSGAGAVTVKVEMDADDLKAVQNRLNLLEMQRDAEKDRVKWASDLARIDEEGIKAEEYRVAILRSGWDNATKLAKEYERIEKAVAAAAAADNPWSEEDIARARAIAAERYKTASGSADLSGFNAEKNQLAELLNAYKATNRELEAQQRAGVLSQDEYMSRRVELIKQERDEVVAAHEREIAALEAVKSQKGVTAAQSIQLDQRIGAARTAMVKAQQDADSQLAVLAINEEGRLARQAFSVRTYTEALEQQAEALRKQGEERLLALVWVTDERSWQAS